MKILSWNCRGINNPETVQVLCNWCWRERPDFVFVMESMIDRSKLEVVRNKCGFNMVFVLVVRVTLVVLGCCGEIKRLALDPFLNIIFLWWLSLMIMTLPG